MFSLLKSSLFWTLALWSVASLHLADAMLDPTKVAAEVVYADSTCAGTATRATYRRKFFGEIPECTLQDLSKEYQTIVGVQNPFSDAAKRFHGQPFVTFATMDILTPTAFQDIKAYLADGKCHQDLASGGYVAKVTPTTAILTMYLDKDCEMAKSHGGFVVNATSPRDGQEFAVEEFSKPAFVRVYDAKGQQQLLGSTDAPATYASAFDFPDVAENETTAESTPTLSGSAADNALNEIKKALNSTIASSASTQFVAASGMLLVVANTLMM